MILKKQNLTKMGEGFKRIARAYGGIKFTDKNGKSVDYIYDYKNEDLIESSQFTKDMLDASEREKWRKIKEQLREFGKRF